MGPPRGSKAVEPTPATPVTSEQMEEVLSRLNSIQERLDSVEKLLEVSQAENAILKSANTDLSKAVLDRNSTIEYLQQKTNNLEQYNRSWSVRIAGLPVPAEEIYNPIHVMRHVYNEVLRPILQGAVDKGLLPSLPPCDQLLETAHILPARRDDQPKPIIARFYSRNLRAMIFQLKKEYGTKAGDTPSANNRTARLRYPIYEDLTKTNFQLMKALADDERTGPVWSIGGVIKYKLVDGTDVKKVSSVFDSVDDILAGRTKR